MTVEASLSIKVVRITIANGGFLLEIE